MPMTVRAWPTAEVPPDEEDRLAWLTLEWAVVDEWVDAFHAGDDLDQLLRTVAIGGNVDSGHRCRHG